MEKIELNIPTIYSHSLFIDESNNHINISKKEIEYFYSLIYLYRLDLLSNTTNLLIKEKGEDDKVKHHWNNNITNWNSLPITIDMYEVLLVINENHNSNYKSLREFIPTLQSLHIEINILNKDTTKASQQMKIVDTVNISSCGLKINIKFNDYFIREYIHINSFYKKVVLNHFFNLSGYKNKVLYLLMKDYVGISKKIPQSEIVSMIGDIFSNGRFKGIVEDINKTTDVKVTVEKRKKGKKTTYFFNIKKQNKFLNRRDEIEFNVKKDLWNKSEDETQKNINKGIDVKNIDSYTKSIYKTKMKHFNYMVDIDDYLEDVKESLKNKKIKNQFQYLVMVSEENSKEYIIDDKYLTYEYPYPQQTTYEVKETYNLIDEGKIGWKLISIDKPLSNNTKSLL